MTARAVSLRLRLRVISATPPWASRAASSTSVISRADQLVPLHQGVAQRLDQVPVGVSSAEAHALLLLQEVLDAAAARRRRRAPGRPGWCR